MKLNRNVIWSFVFQCLAFFTPNKIFAQFVKSRCRARGNSLAKESVLFVPRRFFERDCEELYCRLRNYNWIQLDQLSYDAFLKILIPKKARGQRVYLQWAEEFDEEWRCCIEFSKKILTMLDVENSIKCVLLGNVNYWQEHALKLACKELHIPVVVMVKEVSITESEHQAVKASLKGYNPIANALAVASEEQKKSLIEAGLRGGPILHTVGLPRLDKSRSLKKRIFQAEVPTIVLFSFGHDHSGRPPEIFCNIANKIVQAFGEDFHIIIKARDIAMQKMLIKRLKVPRKMRRQVDITGQRGVADVLSLATVVIGGHSLSSYEALFTDAPIYVPLLPSYEARDLYSRGKPAGMKCFTSTTDLLGCIEGLANAGWPAIGRQEREKRDKLLKTVFKLPTHGSCDKLGALIEGLSRTGSAGQKVLYRSVR